jgi:hypothetical protein
MRARLNLKYCEPHSRLRYLLTSMIRTLFQQRTRRLPKIFQLNIHLIISIALKPRLIIAALFASMILASTNPVPSTTLWYSQPVAN